MVDLLKKFVTFTLTLCLFGGAIGGLSGCSTQEERAEDPAPFNGSMVLSPNPSEDSRDEHTPAISLSDVDLEGDPNPDGTNNQSITVTVSPADTTYTLDLTVRWENPIDDFAIGKVASDYVAFGLKEEEAKKELIGYKITGSKTFQICLLQPFGARIQVCATLQEFPYLSATLNVDYLQGTCVFVQSVSKEFKIKEKYGTKHRIYKYDVYTGTGIVETLYPNAVTINDFVTKDREFQVGLTLEDVYTIPATVSHTKVCLITNSEVWNSPFQKVVTGANYYKQLAVYDTKDLVICDSQIDQEISRSDTEILWKITDENHLNVLTMNLFGFDYDHWSKMCTVSDNTEGGVNIKGNLGNFRHEIEEALKNPVETWVFRIDYSINDKTKVEVIFGYGDGEGSPNFRDDYFGSAPNWDGYEGN